MTNFYSPQTKAFYDNDINEVMPPDVVTLTTEQYSQLLIGVNSGKTISLDAGGNPILVTPAPLTSAQQAALLSVSPRQIRLALSQLGLRESLESAIAASGQYSAISDWYNFSTQFDRGNPEVAEYAAQLNITSDKVDALWILAATL